VQVAVHETDQAKVGTPAAMPNEMNYKVSGIPQIVLLDRAGMVRMIVVGWDPANEAHIGMMINKLLTEQNKQAHTNGGH
jgi:hypothetical protein